jgi:tRNA(fMet)-specific endonuclease VapC
MGALACVVGGRSLGVVWWQRSQAAVRAERPLRRALVEVPCESVPEIAGDAYGQIKAARQPHGLTLDENDLWVAATAKALGAVLVSTDRDFAQIDGLTVEDWTL